MMKRLELILALLLLVAAAGLHITRATKAGGLWRDEAGAVQLAMMPAISDIPRLLEHEAFPILFSLTLRGYTAMAGDGDVALRVFGLLVGLGLLAAVWFVAKTLTGGIPLLALALLGINAAVIQWADWTRGHGLGTLLILLTFAFIWKVATAPSRVAIGLATLAALASVHTLYYNAVLLFAIGLAGAAVAWRAGSWQRALLVLGICGVAALSLLPYLRTIRGAGEWSHIFTIPEFSLGIFWEKLSIALSAAPPVRWIWITLALGTVITALVLLYRARGREQEVALYCLLTLGIGLPCYYLFLKFLKYPTQPWYYVALLGVVAVAMEAVLSTVLAQRWGGALRMALAAAIALLSFAPTLEAIQLRQTNIDLVAAKLQESVAEGDVVVVMPWYLGVPFSRYYHGPAPWTTVPPVEDYRLQRYDLFKAQMAASEPLAPVFEAMEKALRSGHKVWLVGQLVFPQEGVTVPVAGPAPDPFGWSEGAYLMGWMHQAMQFLQDHVATAEEIKIPVSQPLNPHEYVQVIVVRGWRGD
ncbi:hypothetical protein BH20VER1_BH20VER1_05950 [soil metagenome]